MTGNYFTAQLRRVTRPLKHKLKYADADFDPVEYLVFEDRRLVLLIVSKVACTSIKATIGESYGIDFNSASGLDIHSHQDWKRCFGCLPKQYENYDIAAFVRDPFSRLVSCYRDRVVFDDANPDFKKFYFDKYPFDIQPNQSFENFVKTIVAIPDKFADRHFKSQSYSINKTGRELDFCGRFESINDDWESFAKKYDFVTTLKRLNSSDRHNKSLEKDYRKYYSMDTFKIIQKRYQQDINTFGYETSVFDLEKFIRNGEADV